MARLPRASGILLHPTSLPGRFGIGDLGPVAHEFVDFLVETGQRWWQILPLGPTGYGNSPYQSTSSFAGNELLISPDLLVADGLLSPTDLADYPPQGDESRIDYEAVIPAKRRLFERAYRNFSGDDPGFASFLRVHGGWVEDFALFLALTEAHEGRPWYEWEPEVTTRQPDALARWRERLAGQVRFFQFVQYLFDRQWRQLRERCWSRGIHFIGDLPIFVAPNSADVWTRPDLFLLDDRGRPTYIAGVPPDYFSATGQLWGNPLYRWEVHAAEHFTWWIARLRATTDRVDLVRLDHFRGFEAYWEVPASEQTAINGRWALGPGAAFFEAVREALGGLPLIAEDLGNITFEVQALRDKFDLPGMRILQFAFANDPGVRIYLPYSYVPNCIVYTGTHDNDTTVGWFRNTTPGPGQAAEPLAEERQFALRFTGTDGREIHWDLARLALASVADTAIVPLQDVLGLGSEARMNTPGLPNGNWAWRYRGDQLTDAVRHRLADMTAVYNRWNGTPPPRVPA